MKRLLLTVIAAVLLTVNAFSQQYAIGDIVAGFTLKNIDGKNFSVTDSTVKKGYVIIFTCNECSYCKKYEERIIALDKKYAPLGYPVIAINPSDPGIVSAESYDNMVERAKDKGYTFPYLSDPHQNIYPKFAASMVTPTVYVLKLEDKGLTVKYMGAIDDNADTPDMVTKKYVEDAVNALLISKNPPLTSTKAVGCPVREP